MPITQLQIQLIKVNPFTSNFTSNPFWNFLVNVIDKTENKYIKIQIKDKLKTARISLRFLRSKPLKWSKRRDSNPRSPVPEAIGSSLLTTFIYFLVLFSPKAMLSDALVRTVSTQSKSVDGQRCGHRANFARLKARKLNRIYPVLSFIFCR